MKIQKISSKSNFWGFDKWVSQYIVECEEIDYKSDDDTDNIDDAAKALIINIEFLSPSPLDKKNLNTNTFIIFFEIIYSAKIIIIDLANCFFKHALTGNNQDSKHYKSDLFTYITSKRYILDEFYKIMINTKTSKQSIAGYKQYLAYKKNVTPI